MDRDETTEQGNGSESILIVDDDVTLLKTLRKLLEGEGFDVTTAENGDKAMKFVKKKDFDLIVMDVRMPDMDGISLLRRIRYSQDIDSKIIIITAYASEESTIQALELEANAYLKKPFELDEFLGCIRKNIASIRLKKEQREFRRKFIEEKIRERNEFKERLNESDKRYRKLLSNIRVALKSKGDITLRKKLQKIIEDQEAAVET